jgi:hypothetical protein
LNPAGIANKINDSHVLRISVPIALGQTGGKPLQADLSLQWQPDEGKPILPKPGQAALLRHHTNSAQAFGTLACARQHEKAGKNE